MLASSKSLPILVNARGQRQGAAALKLPSTSINIMYPNTSIHHNVFNYITNQPGLPMACTSQLAPDQPSSQVQEPAARNVHMDKPLLKKVRYASGNILNI